MTGSDANACEGPPLWPELPNTLVILASPFFKSPCFDHLFEKNSKPTFFW